MPDPIDPLYRQYKPTGLVSSLDGNTAREGAMGALANLMPSPNTANLFIARPAASSFSTFSGFSNPGYVSLLHEVGNLVFGMLATSRNPGHDEPFVYNTTTNSFLTINGITSANTPTSPATTGAWTPPDFDQVGGYGVFTHPGFSGSNVIGWLDMSGFSSTSFSGTLTVSSATITAINSNPIQGGVVQGMTITASAGIPAGTRITSISSIVSTATYTITMSANATSTVSTAVLTIAGGTTTNPLWGAGNTNQNTLPSVPLTLRAFADRIYYACGAVLYYSDVLSVLNISNATTTQALTLEGSDVVNALQAQPFFATQTGGVVQSLLALKAAQIWQITGDLATSNLALNKLIDGVGTNAPRSVINTAMGTKFLANDGLRMVDLTGQVSQPDRDLVDPFTSCVTPSRVAAAYNVGVYRICTQYRQAGVALTSDFWWDETRGLWTGPHSINYDCITPTGSTFLTAFNTYTGQLLQSNVLPSVTDTYVELGATLTFTYRTVVLPEFKPITQVSIAHTSIAMEFDNQNTIAALCLDQSFVQLGSYTFTTPFLAPSNVMNIGLFWAPQPIVQSRVMFQLTGNCTTGLGFGALNVQYQYQPNPNEYDVANMPYGTLTSYNFGLVTDSILQYRMDWGSVVDSVLGSMDFETSGPIVGPP